MTAPSEGTERPDTAALLTIGDWLVRTLPGHQGAEQTAAALAYTARWIDAQPPVPLSPATQPDGDAIYDELLTLARQGCCDDRRKPCERHDAYADAIEATLHRLAAPSVPTLPAETDEP